MSKLFPEGVSIRWLGHAFFEITSPGGSWAIDPFYENNPAFPKGELARITRPGAFNTILLTHPHGDHIEGVAPLLKGDPALKVVTQFEVANWLKTQGVAEGQLIGMNTGGTIQVNDARVTMVNAVHTSSVPTGPLGFPIGYVLRFDNGFTIYNTGDTAVTMDMQIVRDLYKPNLVILPIGDFYTMGAEQAAYALKLLQPEFAIGSHWGTWDGKPPGTPEALEKELAPYALKTQLLKPKPGDLLT